MPNHTADFIQNVVTKSSCLSCREGIFPFSSIRTNELHALTFNSNMECNCSQLVEDCDITLTNEMIQLEELDMNKLGINANHPNFDNDIDNNLNLKCDFKYYLNHDFHKLAINVGSQNSNNLSVLHTNISSISKNLEELDLLVKTLDYSFDVIALTETWRDSHNEKLPNI